MKRIQETWKWYLVNFKGIGFRLTGWSSPWACMLTTTADGCIFILNWKICKEECFDQTYLRLWKWSPYVHPKRLFLSSELHFPTSQKTAKFKRHALVQPVRLSLERLAVHAPFRHFVTFRFPGYDVPSLCAPSWRAQTTSEPLKTITMRSFESSGSVYLVTQIHIP